VDREPEAEGMAKDVKKKRLGDDGEAGDAPMSRQDIDDLFGSMRTELFGRVDGGFTQMQATFTASA
jgi:hypothetical protein